MDTPEECPYEISLINAISYQAYAVSDFSVREVGGGENYTKMKSRLSDERRDFCARRKKGKKREAQGPKIMKIFIDKRG